MCVRGEDGEQQSVERIRCEQKVVWLKIAFDFREDRDTADFFYSTDGHTWRRIGDTLQLRYTLHHFMGCRIGLIHYATQHAGGYADFAYFRYERDSE